MNPLSVRIKPRLAIGTGLFLITAFFYLTININEINNKLIPSYKTPGMATKPMLVFSEKNPYSLKKSAEN